MDWTDYFRGVIEILKKKYKISKGLKGNYDSLGSIIEEMVNKIQLKAFLMPGERLDLGN